MFIKTCVLAAIVIEMNTVGTVNYLILQQS